jgi:hypothetical protein
MAMSMSGTGTSSEDRGSDCHNGRLHPSKDRARYGLISVVLLEYLFVFW